MGIGRQASQRSDISEDLPPPPPSPPILSSPSPPPPPPPFEDELDPLPPPLPEPLVEEVANLHIDSMALNGDQELPPVEAEQVEDSTVPDLPPLDDTAPLQHEQYHPPQVEPDGPEIINHQEPSDAVSYSPLKVIGGGAAGVGGESSTDSSTLIAQTNDSFSREDSLDVNPQVQDISQGDISIADLSHKVGLLV